jgi:hypothetical protein
MNETKFMKHPMKHLGGVNNFIGMFHEITNFERNNDLLRSTDKIIGVFYISDGEITRRHTETTSHILSNMKEYNENYGHIKMSCGLMTKWDSCIVTYIGIFKNPTLLMKDDILYKNLSSKLHSFGAYITNNVIHVDLC